MKKLWLLLFLFLISAQLVSAKTVSGSITDLLKKKQNLKCTYQFKSGKQTVKGVMYVSGQKFRSEFKTKINKKTVNTYSLSDQKWLYNWTSNSLQGSKMNLKQMQTINGQNTEQNQEVNKVNKQLKTKYQFKCQSFKPAKNFFKAPSKIEFTDLGQMLEGLQNLQQNTCSICSNLPSEAKQACLQSCQ